MIRPMWQVTVIVFAATLPEAVSLGAGHPEPAPPDWRERRLARIDIPPDPSRIQITPQANGLSHVVGLPGAAADPRARTVRVLNLATTDQVAVPVRPDGSFHAELFAPPGTALQINSSMQRLDDLPPEAAGAVRQDGSVVPTARFPDELFDGVIGQHPTSSPGLILSVRSPKLSPTATTAFATRVGKDLRLWGKTQLSTTQANSGASVSLSVTLTTASGASAGQRSLPRQSPRMEIRIHRLFDERGRQHAHGRQPVSSVLTPSGLPIETHGEIIAERHPDGHREWHLGPTGWPLQTRPDDLGTWESDGTCSTIAQRWKFELPEDAPAGLYGLTAAIWKVGEEGQDAGESPGGPWHIGFLKVGSPAAPRLGCMLLGSVGTGGSRGVIAREDCGHFAVNTKIRFSPAKVFVPRDDAHTNRPITYPLDPYLPAVSLAHRPWPRIPQPLIPFDVKESRLTVTVTSPTGATKTHGPAPLVAGQNDLSVLRPDYVVRDRVVPPVAPTYGNPSASDIYHLSGRGIFDHAFTDYGRHEIKLDGFIHDQLGNRYEISGTYDVYVAKTLDMDVFPEPGTPLEPQVGLTPEVRLIPSVPADVEIRWRHYSGSPVAGPVEQTIVGRANRWGVFVPPLDEPPVLFDAPGEYLCDVTVRYEEPNGTLWMASRRGASVIMMPDSDIVVHGERGNRSPRARWRARWFVAGDGRFVVEPSAEQQQHPLPPEASPDERLNHIDLGHTCLPYEPGDVAWLGHTMAYSLFPGLTFEDPSGMISNLIERRWPRIRNGAGREGLYPYDLKPEDRRAIGEMPYVCMTESGIPPSIRPEDIDQWGYFYCTSWRPGVSVRTLVAEDAQPVGYWFFDDPYAYQCGNGPQGDLPGDVKMTYGGGVFRDKATGRSHYGGYASMLVLIDGNDRMGPRVLPPFDGLVPGSPACGPLLRIGGKRYDAFLTFGAVAPGTVLEVGDRLPVSGVVWPPVSGHVEGKIIGPSGSQHRFQSPSNAMGVFNHAGQVAGEPGIWTVTAEGVCSGKTSVGTISELVPQDNWPRGGGIGLSEATFAVPVVPKGSPPITFDVPPGTRARPPAPLVIRGHLPHSTKPAVREVHVTVSLLGQVIDQRLLPVRDRVFEYVYDPEQLRRLFPNIDTRIEMPFGGFENTPAWFDTVSFTFWAGERKDLVAGMVWLQGEELFAQANTSNAEVPPNPPGHTAQPWTAEREGGGRRERSWPKAATTGTAERNGSEGSGSRHSSLMALSRTGYMLVAGHPWSGDVVRLFVGEQRPLVLARANTGGEVRSVALCPDEKRVCVALPDRGEVLILDAASLKEIARFHVGGKPKAALPAADRTAIFVADFDKDRILRLDAKTGQVVATSDVINRPSCLTLSPDGTELYTVSFRNGEVVVLNNDCSVLRRIAAPPGLNQCRSASLGPEGHLYAPQTRSDTVTGGRMFDRSVFPVIAVADPKKHTSSIRYAPDLLVVPPHRPTEVAVDHQAVYLASAGSDDVLAIDRQSGFARWHAQDIGKEPGAIMLDARRGRLFVLTITGQEIVTLSATTGQVLSRLQFTQDPTPSTVARGRYLFGTANDRRLTKDHWMSCAVCHPEGHADGRQWDLGDGPLDTRSLRGCLQTAPLHFDGHLDEIQDTHQFTRMTMAGQWFVPRNALHGDLEEPSAGLDSDLDALAAYITSLALERPPQPPRELVPSIERGRTLFESRRTGCVTCHPKPWYTDSGTRNGKGSFLRHDVGTRDNMAQGTRRLLDTPTLLGLHRSEPYLHDGRAKTLEEVFTKYNSKDQHGHTSHLLPADIQDLTQFLRHVGR